MDIENVANSIRQLLEQIMVPTDFGQYPCQYSPTFPGISGSEDFVSIPGALMDALERYDPTLQLSDSFHQMVVSYGKLLSTAGLDGSFLILVQGGKVTIENGFPES